MDLVRCEKFFFLGVYWLKRGFQNFNFKDCSNTDRTIKGFINLLIAANLDTNMGSFLMLLSIFVDNFIFSAVHVVSNCILWQCTKIRNVDSKA